MNTKISVIKSIVPLLVVVFLLLTAFGGSAVLANFDRSQSALANKSSVVNAARIELASLNSASQASTSLSSTGSTFQNEAQLADDKDINEHQNTIVLENEITGTVTSIMNGEFMLDKVLVQISPSTELKVELEIGLLVKVEGEFQANGTFLAREINPVEVNQARVERENDQDDDEGLVAGAPAFPINFEFTGLLTAITGNTLTVGDKTVLISAATEIKGSLMVGEMVKVEGFLQAGGSVQAAEIKAGADQEDEKIANPVISPTQVMGNDHGGTTNQIGSDDHGGDNNSGSQNLSGSGGQSGDDGGGHGGGDGGGHD